MTERRRKIELLAPARDLTCGLAAVDHGADAVYIGAPHFSARAAAGCTVDDIARLADYAHTYGVRIYVALNTILRDEELEEAVRLTHRLWQAGADALIVQDMGLLTSPLPPIPLHASTQTDNRSPQRVRFLSEAGFQQVVLARELSLEQIAEIHAACPQVPLEVFVHGALCVSYSGQCYASQACFHRSANRGECAQFCRLAFDMTDADGRLMARGKHLLSLKDLCLADHLEQLMDAGVTSLKIEGRLKDVAYVKNITASYRQQLDAIFRRRPEYVAASSGQVRLDFRPQPDKSFSRGFTSYFFSGRTADISQPLTPKSLGEPMGTVKELRGGWITVAGVKAFGNGDGACFVDAAGKLQGFRVNKAETNRILPQEMPAGLRPRMMLYRNADQAFSRLLARPSARREIGVALTLSMNPFGYTLTLTDADGVRVSVVAEQAHEAARSSQADYLRNQLGKLGNTPFRATEISTEAVEGLFLPASLLADLRRRGTERLLQARRIRYPRQLSRLPQTSHPWPEGETLTFSANVMNSRAADFYRRHGVQQVDPAFELQPVPDAPLMTCKHCLRFSMGWCPRRHKVRSPFREPFRLISADGRRFRLHFDCQRCEMQVFRDDL